MKITFCRTKTADNLRLDGLLFEPDKKSSIETYLNIFADGAGSDVFPILKNGDFKELESIKIPTLAFYGGTDDAAVFSPEKDLGIIKKHLKNEKSKTLLIGTAPHSYFKHEEQTAIAVVDWLKEIL